MRTPLPHQTSVTWSEAPRLPKPLNSSAGWSMASYRLPRPGPSPKTVKGRLSSSSGAGTAQTPGP